MALHGWMRFGGNEIVNNERARGYGETAACPMVWFKGPRCDTLQAAVGDIPYTADNIAEAPWYDLSMPELSARFFGVYALSVTGLNDSTRSAPVTEGIDDGAVIGRTRKGARQVRVTALLIARGRDALDYGIAWLNAALDPDACGQHGVGCGTTDLEFLTDCPPPREDEETDEEYAVRVNERRRFLHNVAVTSGPLERDLLTSGPFWGQIMEWTYTAGRPWVYSVTRPVDLPITPSVVIQDVPYNLVPYPSAELAGADVTAATNYSTNPSVETNATGWAAGSAIVTGTDPASRITNGRVVGELQAVGTASFRVRLLGNGSAASGRSFMWAEQVVILTGRPAASRVSVSIWGALLVLGGAGVTLLRELRAFVEWRDGSNVVLRTDTIDIITTGLGGHVFAVKSVAPPAGMANARVVVRAEFDWASGATNSDVRLYADALAVTVP